MKRHPLGVQTFSKIIERNLLYIGKTKVIYNLLEGKYYFYAKPLRFEKSLMLSTIKSIYQGRRDLFKGLWIENKWDWSKKHPVIHIGLSGIGHRLIGLDAAINKTLDRLGKSHHVVLKDDDYYSVACCLVYIENQSTMGQATIGKKD